MSWKPLGEPSLRPPRETISQLEAQLEADSPPLPSDTSDAAYLMAHLQAATPWQAIKQMVDYDREHLLPAFIAKLSHDELIASAYEDKIEEEGCLAFCAPRYRHALNPILETLWSNERPNL